VISLSSFVFEDTGNVSFRFPDNAYVYLVVYFSTKILRSGVVKLCGKWQLRRKDTGLFKMIVGVQLSSGNSTPNSGNNHHLTIPFEGGMHSFKIQGECVSRNWRYESEPPLKPSPLTCYKQSGTNSSIVLMSVESQTLHIQSTCKVCNKNLECCSIK